MGLSEGRERGELGGVGGLGGGRVTVTEYQGQTVAQKTNGMLEDAVYRIVRWRLGSVDWSSVTLDEGPKWDDRRFL